MFQGQGREPNGPQQFQAYLESLRREEEDFDPEDLKPDDTRFDEEDSEDDPYEEEGGEG